MGDRCYMELTCRRIDAAVFEGLGFVNQDAAGDNPVVTMVDEEANYAHSDKMPSDIPYHGHSGTGGSYDATEFGCDGTTFTEWPTGFDHGYVLDVNENGTLLPYCRKGLRKHFKIMKHAHLIFRLLGQPS